MSGYVVYKGVYCQVFEHGWRVKKWQSLVTGQTEMMAWKKRCYEPLRDFDGLEGAAVPDVDQSGTLLGLEREERTKTAVCGKVGCACKAYL